MTLRLVRAIAALLAIALPALGQQPAQPPPTQEAEAVEKSALEELLEGLDDDGPRKEAAAPKAALAPKTAQPQRRFELLDELLGNSSRATAQNPRQNQAANTLRLSFDATEAVTLTAGATVTWESGAPPADGSAFRASYGGTVGLLTGGLDWEANDDWTLGLRLEGSPSSQQLSTTSVRFRRTPTSAFEDADALLSTRSSMLGGGLGLSFEPATDADVEAAFFADVALNSLSSEQRITQVEGRDGRIVSAADLRDYCRNNPTKCTKTVRAVLSEQADTLLQARIRLGATLTFSQDTDLSLSGDAYVYSEDPANLGFFSVATAGRSVNLGGGGVPIAPLRWTVRPEVAHRFGALSLRLWFQGGQYVEGIGGRTAGLGLKTQYRFSRAFRLWVSLAGQRDTDAEGEESRSGTLALGGAYRF